MSFKVNDIINNVFRSQNNKKQSENTQKALSNVLGVNNNSTANLKNPFLKSDGSLFNPYLNYQRLLDNPNVSQTVKNYISQATGLVSNTTSPNAQSSTPASPVISNASGNTSAKVATSNGNGNTSNGNGSTITNAAKKYLGTPYVWGGESMAEGGMDCSGFVYNALKDAGYNVGRTTAQGYRNSGKTVNKSELQPGDLVFYGKNGEASHIGIYIGNGQMIHSSGGSKNTASNPGKGVTISNVDYRSDFIEAKRY